MAWRFRKSVRFPGGFRVNLSKQGVGYSWGFRGFRRTYDSKGRVYQTVSIPGSGVSHRQTISTAAPAETSGRRSIGCLAALFISLIMVWLAGAVAEKPQLLWIVAIMIVLMLIPRFLRSRRNVNVEPVQREPAPQAECLQESAPTPTILLFAANDPAQPETPIPIGDSTQRSVLDEAQVPSSEELGRATKTLYEALAVPLKKQLRKSRGATAYSSIFDMAFMDLICRFAALDGAITTQEGMVYLDIFTSLHPRNFAGLRPQDGVELLQSRLQRNPDLVVEHAKTKHFLLQIAEAADQIEGSSCAHQIGKLMYDVATRVALADGPVTPWERTELDHLWAFVEAHGSQHPPVTETPALPAHSGTELDRMVAEDAIRREARAKAALQAVLKQVGCTEQQIHDVLNTIDEPET